MADLFSSKKNLFLKISPRITFNSAPTSLNPSPRSPKKAVKLSFSDSVKKLSKSELDELYNNELSNESIEDSFDHTDSNMIRKTNEKHVICHECRNELHINMDTLEMLAIKCTCEKPSFFCSMSCHIIHWISLHENRCEYILFNQIKGCENNNVNTPLSWNISLFCHKLNDYERPEKSYFY